MNLAEIVHKQLFALSNWADIPSDISDTLDSVFRILTRESLNRPATPPFAGLSQINPSGLPFQWSFCINSKKPQVRFLCEAGYPGTAVLERLELSLQKLGEICPPLGLPYPSWLDDIVLPHIFPNTCRLPSDWTSAIWFALGAGASGICPKVYINLMQDQPFMRWRRLGYVLRDLDRLDSLKKLCDISGQVSKDSWPAGLAIDVMPDGSAGRIKTYFRSGEVCRGWLEKWYSAVGGKNMIRNIFGLVDALPQNPLQTYKDSTFFLSLEFSTDNKISLKTDVTVARYDLNDQQITDIVLKALRNLGLDDSSYIAALKAIGAWPPSTEDKKHQQLIGYGYEPDGSCHINIYCEPPLP